MAVNKKKLDKKLDEIENKKKDDKEYRKCYEKLEKAENLEYLIKKTFKKAKKSYDGNFFEAYADFIDVNPEKKKMKQQGLYDLSKLIRKKGKWYDKEVINKAISYLNKHLDEKNTKTKYPCFTHNVESREFVYNFFHGYSCIYYCRFVYNPRNSNNRCEPAYCTTKKGYDYWVNCVLTYGEKP